MSSMEPRLKSVMTSDAGSRAVEVRAQGEPCAAQLLRSLRGDSALVNIQQRAVDALLEIMIIIRHVSLGHVAKRREEPRGRLR